MELDSAYMSYRPLLLSIAYRMLGSVSDAEDLVQDVFVIARKWEVSAEGGSILNQKAYLCKIVTNRCIDFLKSARRKREVYVGPWLPEPLVQYDSREPSQDPLQTIMLEDTISYAFLVLLDRLSPIERAVFILREAFDYNYREIADTIGKTELGCRKMYSRLKRKIQAEPDPSPNDEGQSEELVHRFLHAASTGNMYALVSLLTEDITVYTDGGGKVHAATRPIRTAQRVAAFVLGLASKMDEQTQVRPAIVNGAPGLITSSPGDRYNAVISFQIKDGRISTMYILRNPEKLRHLNL
ncbi:RNA polymerase sigma-70 factor [Paenibacillus eucommiae]|uniref:RNA polymerase sigma-70 factor (ECF subfamily) n=1 Tax=Paenibacillus eucommiae TaxID=1355755 RepID=A0ABS4IPA8_9BACL|nr:RNA polymerase sigma-70 factor [Paenibacillus eucommiae]MBP1989387.1 RNA polymerase sigma-70 factor (ECF subfamily) [Paenibacillus eucommiae]